MLGFMLMFVLINIGCNFLQGMAMTSGIREQLDSETGVGGITSTYSTDTSGAPAQYQNVSPQSINAFQQWAFFDYPALFNDENGQPDEFSSAIRYGMLIIVGIGFIISLAFTMRQIFGL